MRFGKLPPNELDATHLFLPPDGALTQRTLSSSDNRLTPKIYIGCVQWGTKEWVGKIYPAKTKEAAFLDHYVNHFNCIELNATHYQLYGTDIISKWAGKAKDKDFRFCPKVPQLISHSSTLTSEESMQLTDRFLTGILAFEDHLGPIFMQVSDTYSPVNRKTLFRYLKSLPTDIPFFMEVRHPAWYSDNQVRKEYFKTLQSLQIGAVISDTAGRRDCVHMELTIPKAFIRFVGNNLHASDYARIDEWVLRIKQWLDNGLQELYFFMHQPEEKFAPEMCAYVVQQINKHCGMELKEPAFIRQSSIVNRQTSMFD